MADDISFVPVPPDGGVVKLPAGDWVPVPGGYRRLWGDGVHDDTEAVQTYYDRFDGPLPEHRTYKISAPIKVRTPGTEPRTPYLVPPDVLEAARRAADEAPAHPDEHERWRNRG